MINQKSSIECLTNSNCAFYDNTITKTNPSGTCNVDNENVICMNKEKAQQLSDDRIKEIFGNINNMPLSSCPPETDWTSYVCKCINNKCVKQEK